MIAIDLFAGAGGFSTGAVAAGCTVAWAANHWPTAVQWHTANHPHTVHACQDLQQADFRDAPAHDILLTRQGIDWRYHALKGSVLMRPLLGPVFGWQPMCGRYCCNVDFERLDGYRDRPALSPDERREMLPYWHERRAQIYELWGAP